MAAHGKEIMNVSAVAVDDIRNRIRATTNSFSKLIITSSNSVIIILNVMITIIVVVIINFSCTLLLLCEVAH